MTRYTDVPDVVKGSIIFLSLVFILGYFVWYPFVKSRKGFAAPVKDVKLPASTQNTKIDIQQIKSNGEIFKDIFIFYKRISGNCSGSSWCLLPFQRCLPVSCIFLQMLFVSGIATGSLQFSFLIMIRFHG